jgi:AcrR family transcriptional regulator
MARPSKLDQKKEQILASARIQFGKFGYQKTTLDDVAKAMGLNKASLYHYYKNKEELFFAVILNIAEVSIPTLFIKAQSYTTIEEKLRFYFGERLHFYLEMLRTNAINKETLISIHNKFEALYEPALIEEKSFVKNLVKADFSLTESMYLDQEINYLFTVVDALKHDSIFKGKLLNEKPLEIAAIKELINSTIIKFIQTITLI